MLRDADLPVSDTVRAGVAAEWARLARPGARLDGPQRVAVAAAARAGGAATGALTEVAAVRIATAAHTVTARWVEDLAADGLDRLTYTEVLGVTARLVAVDTTVRGLGAARLPLPDPAPGSPHGRLADAAGHSSGFVPTVGPAGPTTALSALPDEEAARAELSAALYLSVDEMGQDRVVKHGLTRPQIELVAARASLRNACLF